MKLIGCLLLAVLLSGCASLGFEPYKDGQYRWDHYTKDQTTKWAN